MLRQVVVIMLAICVAIAIFIMSAKSRLSVLCKMAEQLVGTLDYLDANNIEYKVDGNVVSVPEENYDAVKSQLTRAGVDYGQRKATEAPIF